MERLIEDLGKVLSESRAKKARKRKARKRATEADMNLARQIGAAMKTRVGEIERLLLMPWKFESPLELDKSIFKSGDAYMFNKLQADYGMRISRGSDTATADFSIGCYSYGDGEGVVCGALVENVDPSPDEEGVAVENYPRPSGLEVEVEWKRRKKPFDPSKDLWPLLRAVMKELKKKMPDYEEWYVYD